MNTEDKENESDERDEKADGESSGEFSGYGIIPFILKFCEVTNHTFEQAMDYDVSTLFYIVSYEVLKIREQEKQIRRMRNKK